MKHNLFLMGKIGATLDVLLENMGRLSFGSNSSDFKVSSLCPLPRPILFTELPRKDKGLKEEL